MISNAILIFATFAVFALIHSMTAGIWLKDWLARRFSVRAVDGWYRLAYNSFAIMSFIPVFALLVLLPDWTLYEARPPWGLLCLALQALGSIGIVVALLTTDAWHFVGIRQVWEYLSGRQAIAGQTPLRTNGLYRLVRHPLYTFSLVIIWAIPHMTFNLLIFNISATIYFAVGSIFEERRLELAYGDEYRAYRRRVSRLFPCPRH